MATGNQGKNYEAGKQGWQKTTPKAVSPQTERFDGDGKRRTLAMWWRDPNRRFLRRHEIGEMRSNGQPYWRPSWLPTSRPTVVPYDTVIEELDTGSLVILTASGDLFLKQRYGGQGRGANMRMGILSKLLYRDKIRDASEEVWNEHDAGEAKKAVADKSKSYVPDAKETAKPVGQYEEMYNTLREQMQERGES